MCGGLKYHRIYGQSSATTQNKLFPVQKVQHSEAGINIRASHSYRLEAAWLISQIMFLNLTDTRAEMPESFFPGDH